MTVHRTISTVAILVLLLLAAGVPALAQNTLLVTPNSLTFSAQSGSTAPMTQTLQVVAAGPSGTAVDYLAGTTTTSGGTWLSVSPQTGKTPANLTVTANPSGLAPGTYNGSVSVSILGVFQTVPVSLTIGQLGANPASVAFNYVIGSAAPASQVVTITSTSSQQVSYTIAKSTETGGDWLQVAAGTGTSGGTISISVNPTVLTTLAQGTYKGTVTLTPTGGVSFPLQIPVTLTVTPVAQLTLTPTALSFSYQIGGTNNVIQQPLAIASSSSSPLNFAVTVATQSGGSWLVVNPTQGVTPATLTVGIAPGSLSPGTYTGTISILNLSGTSTGSPQTVQVTLTVSSSPLLSLSPNALNFTYQMGTAVPATQTITPSSTSTAMTYQAVASYTSGQNWITIPTASGTTPNPITIGVNPTGLTPGTYTGTVTVTAAGAGNPPQQVPVTLTVSNEPLIMANASTSPTPLSFVYQTGQAVPAGQSVSVTSSTGAQLNYTVAAASTTGGNWLSITPASGSTPGSFSVAVNPSGVAAGTYDGTITITATNPTTGAAAPNSPLTVPVKFYVSNNPLLSVSQNSVTLSSVNGAVTPTILQVTSTSNTDQLSFTVAATTASGGAWLLVSQGTFTTPNFVNVTAVPGSLAPGNYSGTITITATNPGGATVLDSPLTIPVTLSVAAGSLVVPTTPLSFTMPAGGSSPAAQTVTISSNGGALAFTAAAATNTGGNWLTVTPGNATTPAQISVAVNGANLPQGTYQGSVTITSSGASNSPQTIPVNLTVGAAQTIALSKSTLTFSFQAGSPAPAAQTVALTATGGNLPFTTSVTTSAGGNWLNVAPASGTTPANLAVSVNPANLQPGTYEGTVSVASTAANNSPQTIKVTLTVAGLPAPAVTTVENAASFAPGLIAPGEIITLWGANFGPTTPAGLQLDANGNVSTVLADVSVLFDNIAAPLTYVSATQINAIVPYEVAGRATVSMVVKYKSTTSAPIVLRISEAVPAIFTLNPAGTGGGNGTGQGAVLNQDNTINTGANPAAKGSVVQVFATGEGQTTPQGVTGSVIPSNNPALWAKPVGAVTVTIGGRPAQVQYYGSAPGAVAGLFQVNAIVPADAPTGPAVPVVVTVGTATTQAGVTIGVK